MGLYLHIHEYYACKQLYLYSGTYLENTLNKIYVVKHM